MIKYQKCTSDLEVNRVIRVRWSFHQKLIPHFFEKEKVQF